MVDDLTERVQSSQNKLEDLIAKIPGIGAYQKKEQRREADKLLRLHIARELEERMGRLSQTQYALTSQGRLDVTLALERAATKLQILIDRIKTASYGYAGLFDAIKVDEEVLDRLYKFDETMLDELDLLDDALSDVESRVDGEEPIMESANALIRCLEAMNRTFSERQDVLVR